MSNWLTPDYKHLLSSCSKIILVIPCCWWLTIDFAWQNLHVSWLNPPYTPIIVGLTYRFHVYTHYYRNLFPAISTIQRFYPIWHLPSEHPNYILLFRQIFFVFLNCYFWWLLPHSCFYWWYKFFSGWNIMVVQNDLHLFWMIYIYLGIFYLMVIAPLFYIAIVCMILAPCPQHKAFAGSQGGSHRFFTTAHRGILRKEVRSQCNPGRQPKKI